MICLSGGWNFIAHLKSLENIKSLGCGIYGYLLAEIVYNIYNYVELKPFLK